MTRHIYLALGDSVTAGHGATHPSMAFVRHVTDFTRKRSLAERTVVVAQNGWTSKDVWRASNLISTSTWEQTNVLTLMLGGNDLRRLLRRQYLSITGSSISPSLVNRRLQEFGYHMDLLCGSIQQRSIPHVLVATVYNPVPNFPLAVHAMESLNGIIRDTAEHYKFEIADVYKGFQKNEAYYIEGYRTGRYEDLVSPFRRPIHPNNVGHRQIADLITKRLSMTRGSKKKSRKKFQ